MKVGIYNMLKLVIDRGRYDYDDMKAKLDAYLLSGSITVEQYNELTEKINERFKTDEAEETE